MQLTPKDRRVNELIEKFNKYNLAESLKDYHLLVDTLLYLHEAIIEEQVQIKYWQKEAETLFYKFCFHSLTLHAILTGFKIDSFYYKDETAGKVLIDISSAKSVFRSQFEAFLMYHYIYVNPPEDDLKELRYNAWMYSSLIQRQEFPAETEFAKKQKAKELIEITRMKDSISKLKSFQNLSTNQQKRLLNQGSGKLFSHWATILKESGFSEKNPFYTLYTILSIYSHSEGLSILQLRRQPDNSDNVIIQANLDLHSSKLLVCLMINSLMSLSEAVKKKYDALPDQLRYDIEIYSTMAKKEKT